MLNLHAVLRSAIARPILAFLIAIPVLAQREPIVSPDVKADHRVTFRFRDPNAQAVSVAIEGLGKPLPMEKDADGLWSATTEPLEPDFYGYAFVADGVRLIDPSNALLKPNLWDTQNQVHVPGPPSLPWELGDVPHGTVNHHYYRSAVVGDDRDFYVYTPPDYDPRAKKGYPVLYLLHGFSDDAGGWVTAGRMNVILDNLIAQGKSRPMLVVMTLGYGAPEILDRKPGPRDPSLQTRNYTKFRDALFQEVMPAVEKTYRTATDRDSRAIAGLSMGGAESLFVGLNSLDRFSSIGAFSSGGVGSDFDRVFPAISAKTATQPHLLWMSCGKDDRLLAPNEELRNWLQLHNIRATWTETAGGHQWQVWRRNLAAFAPLLFQR